MTEKRTYTAEDYEAILSAWLVGDGNLSEHEDRVIVSALGGMANAMRPGLIEEAMRQTRLYDDIPSAIRKAIIGEAEDATRPVKVDQWPIRRDDI